MSERKSPSKSATLYKVGTKKTGNDGNMWIVETNKNKVKRWVLYKKVSKKTSVKVSKKNNSISLSKISQPKGIFDNEDYGILDIIKSYKNVYELIINKSLEYTIDITNRNYVDGTSKVSYFKTGTYNTSPSVVDMHVVGHLEGNTFTWNTSQINAHYQTFLRTIAPSITNQNTLNTLIKLFSQSQITFPEKYRQTIPYLLSYMYDPKKANIIRFAPDSYSNHSFTYIFIWMSLDIPYWYQMTDYVINEFNNNNYYGGEVKKNNKYKERLLKDDPLSHVTKKYEKLILNFK
jgi:hypothetical protein